MRHVPKTRKQFYKQAIADDTLDGLPSISTRSYITSSVDDVTPLKNVPLTFESYNRDYIGAILGPTNMDIDGGQEGRLVVELNGRKLHGISEAFSLGEDFGFEPEISGDAFRIRIRYIPGESIENPLPEIPYYGTAYLEIVEPDMTKLAPKTRIEKYLAAQIGIYYGDIPKPKTFNEEFVALMSGVAESSTPPPSPGEVEPGR